MDRGDQIREAQQRKNAGRMLSCDLGQARCIRAGQRSIQIQSNTLGRLWVPLEALHPSSEVVGLGTAGALRVRAWWAADKRLVKAGG